MKKVFITIIAVLMFFNVVSANDYDNIRVYINDVELICDVKPMLVNGRTMLPLRAILNGLSVPDEDIVWWQDTEVAEVTHKDMHIFMPVGFDCAYVNGEKRELDSPAFVEEGRTMVPVRFLSETLNFKVSWDEETATVYIEK